MKKIVLLFFIYSSFAMAEQNIFPVHEVQNLLGYVWGGVSFVIDI